MKRFPFFTLGSAARAAVAAAAFTTVSAGLLATSAYAQTTASAHTSATRYDTLGRTTGTIAPDPDGGGLLKYLATRTTYDVRGNVTKQETGELAGWQSEDIVPANWTGFTVHRTVHSTYDNMNRKLKSWQMTGTATNVTQAHNMTQMSYDALGRVTCTAQRMNPAQFNSLPASACTHDIEGPDGKDRITKTVYEASGRVAQVRKAVGTPREQAEVTYKYTGNGKPQFVIDANGNKAQMVYDGHDRQSRWYFPSKAQPSNFDGTTAATALASAGVVDASDYEQYTYDKNGNRTQLRKRDAQLINYGYDALNRNIVKDLPGTADDVYYSYDNRGLQTYARFASTSGQGITTAYDNAGRVTSTTTNMAAQSRTLSYQYDENSNRTRVTHPDGQYFTYSYDGLNRQKELRENGSVSLSDQLYNDQGQFVSNTRAASVENHMQYDAAGRVSILDIRLNGTAEDNLFGFAYTPASQFKSRTTSNNLYANTAHYDVQRSYNVNGLNQYTQAGPAAFTYDANGNLTSDGAVTFAYDTENRLISASGVKNATLKYDPLGRLFEVAAPSGTTRFLYDGDALVGEYNTAGTMLQRYVHGNGVDQPLVWYDGGTVGATNRRHLFANWQGSISAVTNASGTAVAVNAYDAYGIPNDTNIGRFQYTGQILIPELGLYHYKARAYSPYLGRFLQTDPIGYEDQYNLYAYVGNDPVGNVDPTGMFANGIGSCAGDSPSSSCAGAVLGAASSEASYQAHKAEKAEAARSTAMAAGEFVVGQLGGLENTLNEDWDSAITAAAKHWKIEGALIKAIIFEERSHQLPGEALAEKMGFGATVGIGQITVGLYGLSRKQLQNPNIAINVIARHLGNLRSEGIIDQNRVAASLATRYNCGSCNDISAYGTRVEAFMKRFSR